MPLARTSSYALRGTWARVVARVRPLPTHNVPTPIFIIGCGRSGTSLIGDLFAAHSTVSYLHEPYHLWAAIDPATDFVELYSRGEHYCLLDARSATVTAQRRFRRLMSPPPGFTLVEKSPINALRIGYLEAVAPGENQRITLHFVPASCSWLNLVECFFSVITGQAIRRRTFTSVKELTVAIGTFIDHWNDHPRPFTWTKDADEILRKINRAKTKT
jgi:hypothetical protein